MTTYPDHWSMRQIIAAQRKETREKTLEKARMHEQGRVYYGKGLKSRIISTRTKSKRAREMEALSIISDVSSRWNGDPLSFTVQGKRVVHLGYRRGRQGAGKNAKHALRKVTHIYRIAGTRIVMWNLNRLQGYWRAYEEPRQSKLLEALFTRRNDIKSQRYRAARGIVLRS